MRGLWEQGVNGTGVTVALIDDGRWFGLKRGAIVCACSDLRVVQPGLEVWHEDLRSAYVAQSSWDILYNRPLSSVSDRVDNHGTVGGSVLRVPYRQRLDHDRD